MGLTLRTLDPRVEALSWEFHGPKSWWLHGAARGAPCCSGPELPRQCCPPRAVTLADSSPVYSGLRAQNGIIGKYISYLILCLGLFPPACVMWWGEMGDEGQGMLCHGTGAALHTLAEPGLSSAYPELTSFFLGLLC